MKTITVRVPESLAADIESESEATGISKSDVVRYRLENAPRRDERAAGAPSFFELASDLIGSSKDDSMPADFSARKKYYLKKWGYGKKRHR
ncbi:MAG TPA: CopG family transcriptional regulator [Thermoanaerobaculia bacterium]|nr:CopG family transcriptional regulator [Thermoanaerobaculia bacterium]